jgi:hypothetical protein
MVRWLGLVLLPLVCVPVALADDRGVRQPTGSSAAVDRQPSSVELSCLRTRCTPRHIRRFWTRGFLVFQEALPAEVGQAIATYAPRRTRNSLPCGVP